MLKKIFSLLILTIVIFGLSKLSFAMMCGEHSEHQQIAQADSSERTLAGAESATESITEESVNAGNKICPVSGEKIDEKMRETYEYKGKIYNFCCPMCIDEFKKDPEKYIKKVEEELQTESKEQSQHEEHEMGMMQGSETSHQGMHEGHH